MSETTEVKIHFLDYWRKIRARSGLITLVFLMVVVTAAVVTSFLPRQYLAKVTMEVKPDDDKAINMLGSGGSRYDPQFAATQFQILKKTEILNPVIKKLDLAQSYAGEGQPPLQPQKVLWRLIKSLDLQEQRNTSLIDIGVLDTDPKRAADIANTIAREYQDRRMEDLRQSLTRALSQFKDEVDKGREDMVTAAQEAARLREEIGIIDPDPESASALLTGGEHATQMSETSVNEQANRVASLRTVLARIELLKPEELMEALRTLEIDDQTVLKTMPLLQDAGAEEAKLLKTGLGENHPRIRGLRALQETYRQTLSGALQSIRHAQATKLKIAEDTLEALQAKQKESRDRAVKDRSKNSTYTDAKTRYLQAKKIVEAAEMQLSVERMKKAIDFDPAHIWEVATVPIAPAKPDVVAIMIGAVVVGLALGIALAFFIEYLDTSVKTVDDVERFLQVPVLGVVPQNIPILMKVKGEHKDAEAYRILRASVEFNKPTPDSRTITLISGGPGEGKSTTLNNLAFTCAKGGYNVLVVDADLRRPTQHLMFETDNRFGLVDYLTGEATIDAITRTTKIDNLSFIPSGMLTDNNLGLVNSQRMTDLVNKLKTQYDLVFFDAPPILAVSDGSVLASEMDMTIMVVQHRRFPRSMLQRVKQSVQQVGGSLIGVVLNNVDKRHDDAYAYYNSYDQYYSTSKALPGDAPAPELRQAASPRKPISVVPAHRDDADY